MEFLIAGLLVLDLAVTLVCGQLLERETRRQFFQMQVLLAELKGCMSTTNAYLGEIRLYLSRMETLQKKPPVTIADDNETKHSRAIEEGIDNILQYQVGKRREQS